MTVVDNISGNNRVLSGMRSTGKMHLGNYHGAVQNWVELQHEYDCFFFAADWHALTTNYEDPSKIEQDTWDMIVDWIACGLDPRACKIFIQSAVPEHAELYLLLSMITPLGWLERVPTYKDQQEKLKEKDLSTFGFLGYPLIMSSDILIYKAGYVPVGEDQSSHLEFTREIARRFNHIYGKGADFMAKVQQALDKIGKKNAKLFKNFMKQYQEQGNTEALEKGRALLENAQANISVGERDRLFGYLEGSGKIILVEPKQLSSRIPKLIGLDGQKMSKSYNNTISVTEETDSLAKKIKVMQTDPARVHRTDPGDPENCPVWSLHKIYSTDDMQGWVVSGCKSAGIGCVDCKAALTDAIDKQIAPIRCKAKELRQDKVLIKNIVQEGSAAAREVAQTTLEEVRQAMGLSSK